MSAPHGVAQTLGGLTLGVEGFEFENNSSNFFELSSDDPLLGVSVGYTHKFARGWFLRLHGRYAKGEASTTFPDGDKFTAVPQEIWEGRLEWGGDINFERGPIVAPYIGLGYRYYQDKGFGHRTTFGGFGTDIEVEYYYLPVGATVFLNLGSAWTINTRAEFTLLLRGMDKSNTSELAGVNFDIDNELRYGRGAGAEILIRKRFTRGLAIAFGPFIRYWNIDDSEPDNGFFAPANDSVEAGVTFKVTFGPLL